MQYLKSAEKHLDTFFNNKKALLYALVGYGAFSIAKRLTTGLSIINKALPFGGKDLGSRYGNNSWALVTGASKGIGEEFCLQLAERGFNICMMARDVDLMNKVSEKIKTKNPDIHTRIIKVDFLETTNEGAFSNLLSHIQDLDISILVNNIGVIDLNYYEQSNPKSLHDLIILNTFPTVMLTRYLLPKMLKRTKKSAVISLSSSCALRPTPHYQLYSASKIFIHYLSEALDLEINRNKWSKKIDFLSFQPSTVLTTMAQNSYGAWWAVKPDASVKGCLKHLGRYSQTHGSWIHVLFCETFMYWITDDKLLSVASFRARKKFNK